METKLIVTPGDSMWWILRPEFVAFVDKIIMSQEQYLEEKNKKTTSGYHKVTWDRLNVLVDNDIVEIRDINIDKERLNHLTEQTINKIFDSNNPSKTIVEDAIFSYQYWLDFNKQKLDLAPGDQIYHQEISKSMPVWKKDLDLLKREGFNAFHLKPEIIEYVIKNIVRKVNQLKLLNETNHECPMTALKEYEPFLKYIESDLDTPLMTERTAFTYKSRIPDKLNGDLHLPVEPEYDFMRFKLSKIKFKNVLGALINNYKESRQKIREALNRSEEISFGLAEGKLNRKVTTDFININNELLEHHRMVRKSSRYLSYCFFGLSLIPIPPISALFGYLGLKSEKIAEYIDSAKKYLKGITPKGLSTYYSFSESLMDISKLEKFPDIQKENNTLAFEEETFWRT